MQKRRLGMFLATLFLLSSSTTSAYIPSHLEAKQLTDENIVSVEFKSGRNKINELVEEFREVQSVETVEIEVIEEVIEEEVVEVYPTYNPYNILEPSNLTREQMYDILEGTALQEVSRMYIWLEEIYGINALFLVSLSAEESGWGRSALAISNNNIGGIKSADGGWAYFDSWQDCLEYKADLLYNQYLSEDGSYFNGYSIYNINELYCQPNSRGTYGWSENINDIAYGLLNKLYE